MTKDVDEHPDGRDMEGRNVGRGVEPLCSHLLAALPAPPRVHQPASSPILIVLLFFYILFFLLFQVLQIVIYVAMTDH